MHPADEIRGSKSTILSKKRIVLAVTGSIAAVETIKLAREIIRHGAEVYPVMTPAATIIIHPDSLWFATGNKPIIELSGKTEHVLFCGQVKKPVDLLLISPCTANTISKIAHGIDDTAVATFTTTAIGANIPIIIVPAMHISMYRHKILQENINKCKKINIKFIDPNIDKRKAKMADIDEIVANVIRESSKKNLKNKKILIIGGSSSESIDEIRILSNRSSGKTAITLAKNAFYKGADVELWYGTSKEKPPDYIKTLKFESILDLFDLMKSYNLKKFNAIIICAALSDYLPIKQKGKIPSGKKKLTVEMAPAPKIIENLRIKAPKSKIIGFKVEESNKKLKEKSLNLLKKNSLDYVIGNTISGFNKDENEIWIINKMGKTLYKKGNKEILADYILNTVI
jgi:phosphopantothenoylcysteine decarboxylase / phosphopantothenate---cysteine ligase